MSRYAEIIIDIAYNKLDRPFTYRVPERMQMPVSSTAIFASGILALFAATAAALKISSTCS